MPDEYVTVAIVHHLNLYSHFARIRFLGTLTLTTPCSLLRSTPRIQEPLGSPLPTRNAESGLHVTYASAKKVRSGALLAVSESSWTVLNTRLL